jgi:hypothetical protein
MGVGDGRSPPSPHIRPVLPPRGRRTNHPKRQARKEDSAVWQGELRHACPDVMRLAELCERTLDKLLTKLQQANLPVTQPLVDLPADHNFKKGQIMHIINSILKGTALGMDGNRTEYYKYCATPLHRPPWRTLFNKRTVASSTCWRRAPGRRPSARTLTTGGPSFSLRRCPRRRRGATRRPDRVRHPLAEPNAAGLTHHRQMPTGQGVRHNHRAAEPIPARRRCHWWGRGDCARHQHAT